MKTSTHLDVKPYQVAVSNDKNLVFRKWRHKGTHWAVSPLDAAYRFGNDPIIREHSLHNRIVFEFSNGQFIAVGF